VSTRSQNDDSQVDDLTAYGCGKIFTGTAPGKNAARPSSTRRWPTCAPATCSLSPGCPAPCGRSSTCGAGLVVLKQQIDTTTPTGRLVFHVLGAIDEFQRELIVEGTREGLQAARARGRTGGRKPKLNERQAATVCRMYEATGADGERQHTVAEIAEAVGVHRTTVYDYLNKER